MTEYYASKLSIGLAYQDFVIEQLAKKIGIVVSNYSHKNNQYKTGENFQGVEIKYDDKMQDTGNLFFETFEKTHPDNPSWIPSGINRKDNSWLYLIGDYKRIYIFSKKYLPMMFSKLTKREIIGKAKTSKGYLLFVAEAEKYCLKRIEIGEVDDPSPFLTVAL